MKRFIFLLFYLLVATHCLGQSGRSYQLQGEKFDISCQTGDGLNVEYFYDIYLKRSIFKYKEPNVNFYLFRKQLYPSIPGDRFGARWTGALYSPVTGTYRFTVQADDGMRIWLDGVIVMDAWKEQPPTNYFFEVDLEGGQIHDLRVDYMQLQYDHAVAQIYWEYPGKNSALIPTRYLFSSPNATCYEPEEEIEEELLASNESKPSKLVPAYVPKKKPNPVKKPDVVVKKEVEKPKQVEVKTEPDIFEDLPTKSIVTLQDIYFNQGQYTFKDDGVTEKSLDKLVLALKKYRGVNVEIAGHTDNVGSFQANMRLSRNRANKVVSYLISKGISASRLTAKGYGSTLPVANNTTEEGKQKNRRVEMIVK